MCVAKPANELLRASRWDKHDREDVGAAAKARLAAPAVGQKPRAVEVVAQIAEVPVPADLHLRRGRAQAMTLDGLCGALPFVDRVGPVGRNAALPADRGLIFAR